MTAGKVTLFAVMTGAILSATTLAAYFEVFIPLASADNVNTSVTVLNTPPVFDANGFAHEEIESSTSSPTNTLARLAFRATATDSSDDSYYLIICKTAVTPTPNSGAAPTCNGGVANQWAISSLTTSGTEATAATTTRETVFWATEKNDWYGYVCDAVAVGPRCSTYTNLDETNFPNRGSPFVINHPPVFSTAGNNSPQDPGGTVTWTVTATDTDHIRGLDPLTLFVCKTASYSTSTGSGCNGGAWATSTPSSIDTIATSTPIPIPTQDRTYAAFLYVADGYNLGATSTLQASASDYVVNNMAPSIDDATVSLVGTTTNLQLYTPASTSGPYRVNFIVTDSNSCQNSVSGNEISLATTSVYRSGVGALSCQSNADFNTNRCYPSTNTIDTANSMTCTQDTSGAITGNGCSGPSDATVGWSCTFNLWFNADATTANSSSSAETWKGSVQVVDDDTAFSGLASSTTGTELDQFLAFDVSQSSIAYGGVQPGATSSDPLDAATSTDLRAQGNVGLDQWLAGETMCPNWTSSPDYCDHAWGALGIATSTATSTISVWNQRFATSSIAFSSAKMLGVSTTPIYFALQVAKTLATSSIQSKSTIWSIFVPSVISRAGDYSGVNTIFASVSNFNYW